MFPAAFGERWAADSPAARSILDDPSLSVEGEAARFARLSLLLVPAVRAESDMHCRAAVG